ncbi:hypothetical protein J6590_018395 [Homalodisca vitripennis]|nr:hypothetical protein J6590_018395 [Homalodisca vitripennis]
MREMLKIAYLYIRHSLFRIQQDLLRNVSLFVRLSMPLDRQVQEPWNLASRKFNVEAIDFRVKEE